MKSNPTYAKPHKNTETMKDIIWLSVIDDENKPIETNAALRKNNPIYDPQVPPISIFPTGKPSL